ncbi:MAG: hypothetical protein A2143_05575 [Gallionellales bacterium RBG_16_57_15]|nr:MAG: hypothetical protein A2143_05575 [Gallionellales bacterium RBG_16_57_15]
MQKHIAMLTHLIMSNGLLRVFKTIGLVVTLGVSMSACAGLFGHTMSWKEEVKLHDGQVIVVERFYNLGGYPAIESHNRSPLDQTLTFTLSESKKEISWRTEYRDDSPEPNSLGPLLLDVVGGVPFIATSPAGCISYNKWGRPNPPYILFKYVDDEWKRIPLEEFPAELVQANLMSRPDSRMLKSYYTVEQVKEQMRGRRIAAEARTILREPVKSWAGCPELVRVEGGWVSPGGGKSPIPIGPRKPSDVKK